LSELSWVQSVPTLRRSDAEVSRTTFLVQKCLETVLKCLVSVRSVLVPKCLVAEVSGNRFVDFCLLFYHYTVNKDFPYFGLGAVNEIADNSGREFSVIRDPRIF